MVGKADDKVGEADDKVGEADNKDAEETSHEACGINCTNANKTSSEACGNNITPEVHHEGDGAEASRSRTDADRRHKEITESELAPTHMPTEGGMLEGGMHKGGTMPTEGGMLEGCTHKGGTTPGEGGMHEGGITPAEGGMPEGGTDNANERSIEACKGSDETPQPHGKAGKKHKKKTEKTGMRLKAKEAHHAKVIKELGPELCVKAAKAKEACHATATGNSTAGGKVSMASEKALVCLPISHLELEGEAAEQAAQAEQAVLKVEAAEQALVEVKAAKEAVEAVVV